MRYRLSIPLVLTIACATATGAQQPGAPSPAADALRRCTTHAGRNDRGAADSAFAHGKLAETLYQAQVSANPKNVEALDALARAKSQCLLPAAAFMQQGELSSEAMDLLDRAIAVDPSHWMARFVLASIAYRSPAFLGRGKRAAQELDHLLKLQGDSNDNPMFARVFELRGMQLSRGGEKDSARALWMRGARLFPADSALRALTAPPTTPSSTPLTTPLITPLITPSTTLSAVSVSASSAPPPPSFPSVREIPRAQVLMTAGGTADVLQSVQSIPGATRLGEGSDIYTRGGDVNETALMLDGGRVTSLARFEGLNGSMFGALEPWVVKTVRYSSGGFSARYGNALSGVVDIETDGRPRERLTRLGISLVQAAGTAKIPFNSKVGGWINARVSRTGALLASHGRTDEFEGAPHSEEMIASFIATPTIGAEVRATAIVESDESRRILDAAGWRGPFHSVGATRVGILSSRWLSSARPVIVRTSVAGSQRDTEFRFGVLSRDRDERSLASRVDADWASTSTLTVRGGVEHGAFTRDERGTVPTSPSVAASAPTRALDPDGTSANQIGGYVETELTRGSATLMLGLRGDRLPGEVDWSADPRAALTYRRGLWTTRLSTGLFHQGRWQPEDAIPNGGTPSSIPTKARHVVAGVERTGLRSTLRLEAYDKRYDDYRANGSGPHASDGRARGLDFLAQRNDAGRVSGWLGYSLIDATLTLPGGEVVRSPFDVTHSATGSITLRVTDDWSLGHTTRYGSGAPMTPIVGSTTSPSGAPLPTYGGVMSERMPNYARMDARVMRFIRTPGFLLTTYLEVLNIADRANISGITYDASYTNRRPIHAFFASRTLVAGGEFQFR